MFDLSLIEGYLKKYCEPTVRAFEGDRCAGMYAQASSTIEAKQEDCQPF